MRYIFYAIFIYLAYLGLKTLIKKFVNPGSRSEHSPKNEAPNTRRTKINPDNIEDAEFEEIKKP